MRILIVIINCCFCAHVCHADGQESALTNFWVTHPPSYQEPSNYLATLRQLGVDNPNSLVPYLKVKGLQESALFSMRLLELETNQLTSATVQKITELLSKTPAEVELSAIINFLAALPSEAPVELSDQVLNQLGNLSFTNQENYQAAKKVVLVIMSTRRAEAAGMMAGIGRDSATNLLSAVQYPLYEDPDIARKCADLLLARLYPISILKQDEFEPVFNFLLYKSKADPDYLAKNLAGDCCGDENLASIVLWQLNQAKDTSAVAKKALDLFSTECDKNKDVLQAIQTGKLKKEDAFDKAILKYRASNRLR